MDENLVNKLVAERAAPLESVDDVRRKFAPARTLGAGEDAWLAEDAMLEESGVYGLIQHSFSMGQPQFPEFIGYSVLQGLSQNGLIRACIETTTDDMTREWITVRQEALEDYTNDRLIDKINKAMKKFKLQKLFHDAVDLVGYEGGAMIFIDTGAEGVDLLTPLPLSWDNAELSLGGLKRFVLIDPVNVFPGTYNSTNPLRPDYYVPRTWHVLGQQVHSSRLIRLVANECPTLLKPAYNFFGLSQAQILWDYVLHFQECRVAAQRLATKSSLTVFKTELRSILFGAGGTQQLDRRIKYFMQNRDNEGVAVIDKDNEDLVKIESQLTGMSDIVRQSLELLAALNRTPAVKLLGISPSGFNATGESDLRNYYDHIKSQQEKILRPAIETCLDAIQISENGTIDRGVTFDFNPLRDEDKFTIASYQKAKAETASIYLQSGVVSPDEVRQAIADDEDSGFSQINPDVETEEPPQQGGGMPMGGMMGMDSELDDDDIAEDKAKPLPDGWRWITSRGKRIFIDENGTIQAGLGGKFNGKSISELGSEENKPSGGKPQKTHTYTAAELGGTEFTSKTGKTFIHVPSVEKFCELLQSSRDANNIVDPANTWRVSAPDAKDFAEEHPNAKCFATPGGSAFAVSEDGDIVSVCLCPGDTTIGGGDLVRMALEHGGRKLDSFTGNHEFYVHMGFEPVSLCTWNPEFKPDMWVEGKHNAENIIFYRYTGKVDDPEWKKKPHGIEPLLPHFDDYGEAQKFRDARLSDGIAQDGHYPDQWVTVHPNDEEKGHHVLIDGDTGGVKAGMGGKFNHVHIRGVPGYRGSAGRTPLGPVAQEEPEKPKEPEKPEKPKEPQKPEKPEEPQKPEKPEEPQKPERPEEPEKPKKPEAPEPSTPSVPAPNWGGQTPLIRARYENDPNFQEVYTRLASALDWHWDDSTIGEWTCQCVTNAAATCAYMKTIDIRFLPQKQRDKINAQLDDALTNYEHSLKVAAVYHNVYSATNIFNDAIIKLAKKTKRSADAAREKARKKFEAQKEQKNFSPPPTVDEKSSEALRDLASSGKIGYNPAKKLDAPLTESEIISKLAGGDMTKGSCVSLAYAYAANRCGLDVRDFRGGASQDFFAIRDNRYKIMQIFGINYDTELGTDAVNAAMEVLQHAKIDKEYILCVGRHAAIVKRDSSGLKYLELQSPSDNGFKKLDEFELELRFDAKRKSKFIQRADLIEVESFKNKAEFEKIAGFFNTDEEHQVKGEFGSVR